MYEGCLQRMKVACNGTLKGVVFICQFLAGFGLASFT
jgi:hypothetical protein